MWDLVQGNGQAEAYREEVSKLKEAAQSAMRRLKEQEEERRSGLSPELDEAHENVSRMRRELDQQAEGLLLEKQSSDLQRELEAARWRGDELSCKSDVLLSEVLQTRDELGQAQERLSSQVASQGREFVQESSVALQHELDEATQSRDDLSCKAETLAKEAQSLRDELSQAQDRLSSLAESHSNELVAFQEKAKLAVKRLREHEEDKLNKLSEQLQEAHAKESALMEAMAKCETNDEEREGSSAVQSEFQEAKRLSEELSLKSDSLSAELLQASERVQQAEDELRMQEESHRQQLATAEEASRMVTENTLELHGERIAQLVGELEEQRAGEVAARQSDAASQQKLTEASLRSDALSRKAEMLAQETHALRAELGQAHDRLTSEAESHQQELRDSQEMAEVVVKRAHTEEEDARCKYGAESEQACELRAELTQLQEGAPNKERHQLIVRELDRVRQHANELASQKNTLSGRLLQAEEALNQAKKDLALQSVSHTEELVRYDQRARLEEQAMQGGAQEHIRGLVSELEAARAEASTLSKALVQEQERSQDAGHTATQEMDEARQFNDELTLRVNSLLSEVQLAQEEVQQTQQFMSTQAESHRQDIETCEAKLEIQNQEEMNSVTALEMQAAQQLMKMLEQEESRLRHEFAAANHGNEELSFKANSLSSQVQEVREELSVAQQEHALQTRLHKAALVSHEERAECDVRSLRNWEVESRRESAVELERECEEATKLRHSRAQLEEDRNRNEADQTLVSELEEAKLRCDELSSRVGALAGEVQQRHDEYMDAQSEFSAQAKLYEETLVSSEELSAQWQEDFSAQKETYKQEASALQEKTRGVVQRMREQAEQNASKWADELGAAREDSLTIQERYGSELKEAREQVKAAAGEGAAERSRVEEALREARRELRTSEEQTRRVERELEMSKVECQELLSGTTREDARPSKAALEARLVEAQTQLSQARIEGQAAARKVVELSAELASTTAQVTEMRVAVSHQEEECQKLRVHMEDQEGELLQELAQLRKALAEAHSQREFEARANETPAAGPQEDFGEENAAATAAAAAMEVQMRQELDRLRAEHEMELARLAEAHESHLARSQEEGEVERLRDAHTRELAQMREGMAASEAMGESRKQLVQALRQRLSEQERQAEEALEALRKELEEANRPATPQAKCIAQSVVELTPRAGSNMDEDEVGWPIVAEFDASFTALGSGEDGSVPPENAGAEGAALLRTRLAALEQRCRQLQKKLDARPIIYQAPPEGTQGADVAPQPLLSAEAPAGITARRRPGWEPWLRDTAAPVAQRLHLPQGWEQTVGDAVDLLCHGMGRVLRGVTQQILKRDSLLLVFYAHLLMLYAITASCLANTGTGVADPLQGTGITLTEAQSPALAEPDGGNANFLAGPTKR